MRDVTRELLNVLTSGKRGALATVVRVSGSVPQEPGARLLLAPDGTTTGTVGGGAVERAVLEALEQCRAHGRPELVVYDLARDLGMCCGGRMEIFVEPVEATQRLIVFGAGHVAKPTAQLARQVGFDVTVVDDREELATEERFPGCTLVLAEPSEAAARLAPRAEDWLLVVTYDHRLDEEALDTFARLPHRYLGLIGSRRKVFRILQRIAERGPLPPLERVYAPVGLDIGAVSPEEIAVSIVAELVALRHGKAPAHMRAVDDPRLARVLSGDISPEAAALVQEAKE
ncbi:MAG: XdhC family protein [Polyangiaceae bacterium]|nr:XdhC family protein [Polyangiaceae bacterium]MCE7894942.1 xanthine dehydrogenase accessory protein XdhC [Sorangiineae bacterium PRO1]MCL4755428.1 XdhC family protein [Myxococcales bacterium]